MKMTQESSTSKETKILQFEPFTTTIDPSFWHTLTHQKLHIYKLDDTPKPIRAYYDVNKTSSSSSSRSLPPFLNLDGKAFVGGEEGEGDWEAVTTGLPPNTTPYIGTLINTNTFETFQSLDKSLPFHALCQTLETLLITTPGHRQILSSPWLLNRLLVLCFADLKKFLFWYYVAVPVVSPVESFVVRDIALLKDVWSVESIRGLWNQVLGSEKVIKHNSFFMIETRDTSIQCHDLSFLETLNSLKSIYFAFTDPCSLTECVGWPLRNFLLFLSHYLPGKISQDYDIKIICFRDFGAVHESQSLVLTLPVTQFTKPLQTQFKHIGWEKNSSGKVGVRKVDLGNMMDPIRLINTSSTLNLQLMKWRLAPSLPLDKIQSTKILILGFGTLGHYLTKTLIGWGSHHITVLDCGKISASNVFRQPFFNRPERDLGRWKAEVGVERCCEWVFGGGDESETSTEILGDGIMIKQCKSFRGVVSTIPMPGHASHYIGNEVLMKEISVLETEIRNHDVIFLATDSRESRWLPSVFGRMYDKIVINVALGFDSWLVMRHGCKNSVEMDVTDGMVPGNKLGCYFCNDLVVTGDTLSNKPLDQQCTVTRPGLAPIAAGLATELMISLLWNPLHHHTPALLPNTSTTSQQEHIPHQLRGYLTNFSQTSLVGFVCEEGCIVCSEHIQNGAADDNDDNKMKFLVDCIREEGLLERVSGKWEMMRRFESLELESMSDDE